ncbi:MAG TPA: GNAT family N-acetyltransferase [Granulicella sp.]
MVLIRAATQDDASSISRVHVESWRTTYRGIVPDQFLADLNVEERAVRWREVLRSDPYIFIAELDGKVVGFISGGAIREPLEECDAELFAIYLLAETQGKGIGTSLLMELAKHLEAAGFQSMAVWVLEANVSRGFYERSGAVRVTEKEIEIGGVLLPVVAYAWPSFKAIVALEHLHE